MRLSKGKYLYMKVTKDKFELPVAIADSPSELAEICKIDVSNVHKQIRKDGFIKKVVLNETDV